MQIAHLSDVHVIWPAGSGGPWYGYLNKRVLGWLNLRFKRSHSVEILEAAVADLAQDPPDHLGVQRPVDRAPVDRHTDRSRDS